MTSRRLTRSRDDAMLGGVCAGISRTYDLDPTLVRLGFVLLTVVGGIGVVAYFVLWVLVPFDDDVAIGRDTTPAADASSSATAAHAGAGAAGTSRAELDEAAKHAAEAARHAAEAARVAASAAVAAADQLARSTREALRRDPAPHGPAVAGDAAPADQPSPGSLASPTVDEPGEDSPAR